MKIQHKDKIPEHTHRMALSCHQIRRTETMVPSRYPPSTKIDRQIHRNIRNTESTTSAWIRVQVKAKGFACTLLKNRPCLHRERLREKCT